MCALLHSASPIACRRASLEIDLAAEGRLNIDGISSTYMSQDLTDMHELLISVCLKPSLQDLLMEVQ